MSAPRYLLKRMGTPSGPLAELWAWLFNRANAGQNAAAVEALELRGTEHVLDVGFGGGASFPLLLRALPNGHVTGVDPVKEMVVRARRKWEHEVSSDRLRLQISSAEDLGGEGPRFDAALTVNTVYFWRDLQTGFRKIQRVLAPGARFVVCVVAPEVLKGMGFPRMDFRAESAEFYADQLSATGFENVERRTAKTLKPATLIVAHCSAVSSG